MTTASDCRPTAAVDDGRLVIADPCRDGAWLAVETADAAALAAQR